MEETRGRRNIFSDDLPPQNFAEQRSFWEKRIATCFYPEKAYNVDLRNNFLKPKNAKVVVREILEEFSSTNSFIPMNSEGHTHMVSIPLSGKNFTGTGTSIGKAKEAACEKILKTLFLQQLIEMKNKGYAPFEMDWSKFNAYSMYCMMNSFNINPTCFDGQEKCVVDALDSELKKMLEEAEQEIPPTDENIAETSEPCSSLYQRRKILEKLDKPSASNCPPKIILSLMKMNEIWPRNDMKVWEDPHMDLLHKYKAQVTIDGKVYTTSDRSKKLAKNKLAYEVLLSNEILL